MAPNYAAGRDMVAGVERTFKGKILGKDLTKWPTQLDFSAELAKARAAKPDGVFIFIRVVRLMPFSPVRSGGNDENSTLFCF